MKFKSQMAEPSLERFTEIVLNKLMNRKLAGVYQVTEREIVNNIRNLNDITLVVTERCNLSCVYCAYGDLYKTDEHRGYRNMKIDMVKKFFSFLSQYWDRKPEGSSLSVSFYGGEPLLNMSIIKKTVDLLLLLFPSYKISFSITSNGLLLDNYMDYLVDNNFRVLISLDGNRVHNSYRVTHGGKESFDIVIKNVDELKEKYPDYFNDKISFNTVLHDKNNADDVIEFIKNKYDKRPKISPLVADGVRKDKIDEFIKMKNHTKFPSTTFIDLNNNMEFVNSPIGKSIRRLLSIFDMYYGNYSDLIYLNPADKFHTGSCTPFKRILLSPDGKLRPCVSASYRYSIADVNKLEDIDLKKIADSHNELVNTYFNSICKKCASIRNCHACVYTRDWIGSGPVNYCRGLTDYDKFVNDNNDIIKYLAMHTSDYTRLLNFFKQ